MKNEIIKIKDKYMNSEISSENALQEIMDLYGIDVHICHCNFYEWIQKPDSEYKLYCSNCGKLMLGEDE